MGSEDKCLFSGDTVYLGGRLSLLNCPASSMESYRNNLSKLPGLGMTCFFPGHGVWMLKRGQKQIDIAIDSLKSAKLSPMYG